MKQLVGGVVAFGLVTGVKVAWRWLNRKVVSRRVERELRDLRRVCDDEEYERVGIDGSARMTAEEWDAVDTDNMDALMEDVIVVEGSARGELGTKKTVKRVRRGCKNAFVKYWVAWAKVQFPNAWRGASSLDRVCITNALTREMRSRSVRDSDIARVKDQVVLLTLLPSATEALVAQMEASHEAYRAQEAARGWRNAKGSSGLQLGGVR
jgi:uncharacterized protein YheU (UPF0270 family)